jgi:hypothetical protein
MQRVQPQVAFSNLGCLRDLPVSWPATTLSLRFQPSRSFISTTTLDPDNFCAPLNEGAHYCPCGRAMGHRVWSQRSTLYDLYVERDTITWYFRILTTTGSICILSGYILFAFAATSDPGELAADQTTLIVAATTVLVIGVVLTILTYLFVTSWLFRFDVVLIPTLISSSIGFLAILLHQGIHQNLSYGQPLVYLPLLFAALGILVSASGSLWTHRCIQRVRVSDNRRREHRNQYQDAPIGRHESTDSAAVKLLPDLPSEELQRQQLERLLFKRTTDRAPSPDAQSNTYRIDLPSPDTSNHDRHLSVPSNGRRIRSSSEGAERSSWHLQNLRNLLPGKRQTHQADAWKDPRERRREEIEMADPRFSILRTPASAYDGWLGSPHISPPTQSPAYRYA